MHRSCHSLATAWAVLLCGCENVIPWHQPAVDAYVSEPVPSCPPSQRGCDPLSWTSTDSALLASLSASGRSDLEDLERRTRMRWRRAKADEVSLHVDLGQDGDREDSVSVYVVEALRSEGARDTVLSLASNGGATVWLNGNLLGASRSASRPARAHQDLYTVALLPGSNVLVYKVLTRTVDAQLHREWHGTTALPDLLEASIDLGAYASLARNAILPDTATGLDLVPPQVRLVPGPRVTLRWKTLPGEELEEPLDRQPTYPPRLSLPSAFRGMAVLRTEITDAGSGRLLYVEECPVFADSTANRLARSLAADTTATDPVRIARVDAVRAAFELDPEPRGGPWADWPKALALASLIRHVAEPASFHRHPGAQVWGYRAADGTIQPYWLTVPPSALSTSSAGAPSPGLVFSVTHHIGPDYWAGRGRPIGFLLHLVTLGATQGHFGVLPHLRGVHDFDVPGAEEVSLIVRQVSAAFQLDTSAVAMLVWSQHAAEALQLAQNPLVPLSWLGLAVPALPLDPAEFDRALDSIRVIRPELHWLLWRASRDAGIPRPRIEGWASAIRRASFPVNYREVPYSTHLGGFFDDIEAELHHRIAVRRTRVVGRITGNQRRPPGGRDGAQLQADGG